MYQRRSLPFVVTAVLHFFLLEASLLEAQERPLSDSATQETREETPPTVWQSIQESIIGGKFTLNLRLRAEIVDQDGLDTAQAYTERLRLGYGTRPFHGFSLYADVEDIHSADEDLYNAAGLNGEPNKAVVADPEDTELNQAYAKLEHRFATFIGGRQRITLDDQRFVGNVGWRQNEQTYDAALLRSVWVKDLTATYAYVWDVNRIFGPDANLDFESDSHFINLSYSGWSWGTLTGYSYLLDFSNADTSSSNTVGLRLSGAPSIHENYALKYAAAYAFQADAGDNPDDYKANYFLVEAAVARKKFGDAGAGFEVLGTDDGKASFQTPLATLHKFNGWADVFLTTPTDGLHDLYLFGGLVVPYKITTRLYYHWYWTEEGGGRLGQEFDWVTSRPLGRYVNLLAKLAVFDGKAGLADRTKVWVQGEVSF